MALQRQGWQGSLQAGEEGVSPLCGSGMLSAPGRSEVGMGAEGAWVLVLTVPMLSP